MKNTIWIILTLGFIIWAFIEQSSENPKIWVQVLGVLLFFFAMMRLSQRINKNQAANQVNQNPESNDTYTQNHE